MLYQTNDKNQELSLQELHQFSFSAEQEKIRPSIYTFANLVLEKATEAEFRVIKSKWFVTEQTHLYGVVIAETSNTLFQEKDSTFCTYCRYSNSDKFVPRFVSALRIDGTSCPKVFSAGHVAYRRKMTDSAFITDAIEEGLVSSFQKLEQLSEAVSLAKSLSKKQFLSRQEALGFISTMFLETGLPITKSKIALEYLLSRIHNDKIKTLNIMDVLYAINFSLKKLSIPDQYATMSHGIPGLLKAYRLIDL